jgi:ABC-type Zn uptake system ZnuABC Zn-binding protein ZnuA
MLTKIRTLVTLLIALCLLLTACGATATTTSTTSNQSTTKKLKVVTTVAPITNVALNIGGTRIELQGIVPDGVDSHTFEPAPSDSKYFAEADLIIVNGLRLEEPTLKLAETAKKKSTPVLKLGDGTVTEKDWIFDFSFPKDKGDPNPHLWMSLKYTMNYGKLIHAELLKLDSAGKDYYDKNLAAFNTRMQSLYEGIKTASQTVPVEQRRLLTYHDSWAYWARDYDWMVVGAIQPSNFSEPSAKEVAEIIDQIKKEKITAIFGSEVFPSPVLEQIAKESGAKFIDKLSDDELPGAKNAPNHTYYGLLLENMRTMLPALGGNADALKNISAENTYIK